MAQYTLYLIGYGNQIAEDFFARLEQLYEAWLVIDVRARRSSWCRSYRGPGVEYLFKKRGHRYLWLPELGNGTGRADEVELINEPAGLMALEGHLVRSDLPVILLCAEFRSAQCHRRVVAERLAERLSKAGHELEIRGI